MDGAANHKGSGIGIILVSLKQITMEKSLSLGFPSTNNKTEYEALQAHLSTIRKLRGRAVEVYSYSRLIIG